jgi:dipeptidase E
VTQWLACRKYTGAAFCLRIVLHEAAYEWLVGTHTFFAQVTLLVDRDDLDRKTHHIYMGGGYSHILRDTLRHFGINNGFFKSFIARGGILYGGSAGGVVLGRTLLSSREVMLHPTDYESVDNEGFDICSGFSFEPHYTNGESEIGALRRLATNQNINILALGERSGVVFDNDGSHAVINPEYTLPIE